jgi:hypothetical protein
VTNLEAANRRSALDAIEDLVDRYISPAEAFLASGEDPGYRYYDLDAAAGIELHGLALGLLADDFPELQAPPADAAIEEALGAYGIELPDAEHRSAFFRAWMASRASTRIAELADTIAGAPAPSDRAEAAWELDRLRAVAAAPIPTLDRRSVDDAIAARRAS